MLTLLQQVTAIDPTTYSLVFNDNITYDNSGDLDNFTVDGATPDPLSVVQTSGTTLTCVFSGGTSAPLPWSLAAQPSQISEPLSVPASGFTF